MSIDAATEKLALLGGPKAIRSEYDDLFRWPIVTEEDEQAVQAVLPRAPCPAARSRASSRRNMPPIRGASTRRVLQRHRGFAGGDVRLRRAPRR